MSTPDLKKKLTKDELLALQKNIDKLSVPIMADGRYYPNHVKVHPDREKARPSDRFGNPVAGKLGRYKHIPHASDLYDDEGKHLPIVPIYADRMRAGSNGRDGGPGFPYDPRWYGHWGWASLAGAFPKDHNLGGMAERYVKLLQKYPKGYLGLVTVGSHLASAGNSQFIRELRDHVLPQLDTSEKEGKFMDFVHSRNFHKTLPVSEKFSDPADFFEQMGGHMNTTNRMNAMSSMLGVQNWDIHTDPKDFATIKERDAQHKSLRDTNKKFVSSLDLHHAVSQFNDYAHVPAGHGVSLVKILPHFMDFDGIMKPSALLGAGRSLEKYLAHGGHPDLYHLERPGSPVYPGHIPGIGLGDFLHSVPLHGLLIHNETGERSYQDAKDNHVFLGMPNAKKGGRRGEMYASGGIMMTAPTFTVDEEALTHGAVADHGVNKIAAYTFNVSPEHHSMLDKINHSRYNGGEGLNTMRNITAEDYKAMSPADQGRLMAQLAHLDPPHLRSIEAMDKANGEVLDQIEQPEVQTRLRQLIRGVVQK